MKAKSHRFIAWIMSGAFITILVGGLGLLIQFGWPSIIARTNEIVGTGGVTGFEIFLPLALLVVPTLAAAWLLRHISRLVIQNFALAEDADLRSTIAVTFLSITKDKENVDAEMAILLQALFRPTDGAGHAEIPPPQLDELLRIIKK